MSTTNGQRAPAAPMLVGETCVTIHVLHFADGTASSEQHVTYNGQGHLANRPTVLANILRGHADGIAASGLLLPPGAGQ